MFSFALSSYSAGSPWHWSLTPVPRGIHSKCSVSVYWIWVGLSFFLMNRKPSNGDELLPGDLMSNVFYSWASLVAQLVKNPPAVLETWVRSLGWEDPLEKGTATHAGILAWRIPWTVLSMVSQRVGHDWATFTILSLSNYVFFFFLTEGGLLFCQRGAGSGLEQWKSKGSPEAHDSGLLPPSRWALKAVSQHALCALISACEAAEPRRFFEVALSRIPP